MEDVKTLLGSLKVNYKEKEVFQEELPEQQAPTPTPPVASKAPTTELTPEEILKMHKKEKPVHTKITQQEG